MSGNALGSIFVELKANVADFISGMSKASYVSKQTAGEIKRGFGEMGSAVQEALGQFGVFGSTISSLGSGISKAFGGISGGAGGAIAGVFAVGAAGVAAAAGLTELAISGAELVENFSNISQKTGISIRDLQTFQAAGAIVGVSLDDMVVGLRKFDQGLVGSGKGAGLAALVLKNLGVTSKDSKEALLQTADAFQKMTDGPQKAADAVALFGKSGLTLIPLLNQGRSGIEEAGAAVDQYAALIGGDAVAANEKYRKSTENMSLLWDAFKINLVTSIIPVLTSLLTKLAAVSAGVRDVIEELSKKPSNALSDFVQGFNKSGGSIIGGLVGAYAGAGDVHDDPSAAAATKAASDKTKQDAADKYNDTQEKLFQIMKAGGTAAQALESARLEVAAAVQANDWKDATALQAKIPALVKAAALEKEQLAVAQHNLEIRQRIAAIINQGQGGSPFLGKYRAAQTPEQQAASVSGAPDLGSSAGDFDLNSVLGKIKPPEGMDVAKSSLEDFYKSWGADSKKTADDVNADYDGELKTLQAYVELGELTLQQYKDASVASEKARYAALKAVWADSENFGDQFKAFFAGIADNGSHIAKSFFADMSSSLDALNGQLAQFIVTGKKINFQKLGQGLETNLASTGIKGAESFGMSALGGLFGIKGGKKGDSASNPMYVTPVSSSGNEIGGLGGAVGNLPFTMPGAGLPGLSALTGGGAPGAAAGGGGILGGLFGKLLGFLNIPGLAGGGDVMPGKTYIVGEDHPEFFSPKTAGTIAPSLKFSGGKPAPVINFHVNGVSDFDSFRRSQPQIAAGLQQQLAIASARNR
jgi:hypothetical protein